MEMLWWTNLPAEARREYVAYLNKLWRLKTFDNPRQTRQKEMIRDLIIPTLTEGEGFIPEDMARVLDLTQRWGITNGQLATTIYRLYKNMIKPLDAKEAGRLVGRTANTLRRWAREGKIEARINERGHWVFCREYLIDHIE